MPGLAGDFFVGNLAQQLQLLFGPDFVVRIEKRYLKLDPLEPHIATERFTSAATSRRGAKQRNFLQCRGAVWD